MHTGVVRDFSVALLIGGLVGIERERHKTSESPQAFGGLRTFILMAEAGAVSAWLSLKLGTPWIFVATLAVGSSPTQSAQWFGSGFWDLVAFTMQMSMIIVTGYAVATSAPVYAVIRRMALVPKTGRGAAAYVGLFSMLASLVSWSFSLIFSGLLAREVAHRVKGSDYRAIGAAAYLGVGSVWALGLSSSAALIMAAPASLPDAIEKISGVIPLSQTLLLWQSLLVAALIIVASMLVSFYSAPAPHSLRTSMLPPSAVQMPC